MGDAGRVTAQFWNRKLVWLSGVARKSDYQRGLQECFLGFAL